MENPRNFVATHIMNAAQQQSGSTRAFYTFYLISQGLIKAALIVGLLQRNFWSIKGPKPLPSQDWQAKAQPILRL